MLFTVASARSVVSMRPLLEGLPLSLPVIELNGAFISDLRTGRHQVVNAIDPALLETLYNRIREHGFWPFVSSFNGSKDCLYYDRISNPGMEWYLQDRQKAEDPRLKHSPVLEDSLSDQVVCLTLIDREEALAPLASRMAKDFADQVELNFNLNLYSPGWHWLTIYDRRANKDQAIRTLLSSLGLGTEQLTVFGDDLNDLKMFEMADRAVAVANARPQLKKIASDHIGSNEQDSVARYIVSKVTAHNLKRIFKRKRILREG